MGFSDNDFPLFLEVLANQRHKHYEASWREFEKKYKDRILAKLHLALKDEEAVQDCFSKVLERLVLHNFKAITDFRERKSESAFVVYLLRIAWTIALSQIKGRVNLAIDDLQLEAKQTSYGDVERKVQKWLVLLLRNTLSCTRKESFTLERGIFIFVMRVVGNFHSKDISTIPLLGLKDEHAVDVIKSRFKKIVNKSSNVERFRTIKNS